MIDASMASRSRPGRAHPRPVDAALAWTSCRSVRVLAGLFAAGRGRSRTVRRTGWSRRWAGYLESAVKASDVTAYRHSGGYACWWASRRTRSGDVSPGSRRYATHLVPARPRQSEPAPPRVLPPLSAGAASPPTPWRWPMLAARGPGRPGDTASPGAAGRVRSGSPQTGADRPPLTAEDVPAGAERCAPARHPAVPRPDRLMVVEIDAGPGSPAAWCTLGKASGLERPAVRDHRRGHQHRPRHDGPVVQRAL